MVTGDDLAPRCGPAVVPVRALTVWRRFVDGDDVHAACAQTRSPVPGPCSNFDDRAEAGERRQRAIIRKDVRVALREIGKPVGSDAGEHLLEPVAIHDPHRLVEIDAKYAPPLPPPISTDAGAEPT